jgi:hypothetical protein
LREDHAREVHEAATQRKQFASGFRFAARRQRRHFGFFNICEPERIFPAPLCHAERPDAPAFGQLKCEPVVEIWLRVGEIFEQRQADLIFRRQIFYAHAIRQRLAGRADARQNSRGGKIGAEEKTARPGKN